MIAAGVLLGVTVGLLGMNYFREDLKDVPALGYVVRKLPTAESISKTAGAITVLEPLISMFVHLGERVGDKTMVVDLSKTISTAYSIYTHTNKTAEQKHSTGDFYAAAVKTVCKGTVKTLIPTCGYVDLYVCEPIAESLSLAEKDRKAARPVIQAPLTRIEGWGDYIWSDSLDFFDFYVRKLDRDLLVRSFMAIPTKAGPVSTMSNGYEYFGLRGCLEALPEVLIIKSFVKNFVNTLAITSAVQLIKAPTDELCTSVLKEIKSAEPHEVSNAFAFGALIPCVLFGPSIPVCVAATAVITEIADTLLLGDTMPLSDEYGLRDVFNELFFIK